jgi:hypothetical protein
MRIPIGKGEASATLADTDAGGIYVLATTLATFLPAGAAGQVVSALTNLVKELSDVMTKYGNCLVDKNWLQQLGCRTVLTRDVSFAIGRAGVVGLGKAAVSLITSVPAYLKFLDAQPAGIRKVLGSERTIRQRLADTVPARPLTVDSLLTAPVPSLCDLPSGNLVDGTLPGIATDDGGVWLFEIGWTPTDGQSDDLIAFGDLDADGRDEAVVTFGCYRGGVAWPDTVQVYAEGPTHRAQVRLSDIYDTGWEHREGVRSVNVNSDGTFAVDWWTHAPGDVMCCPRMVVRGTFGLNGDAVEVRRIEVLQDDRLPPDMAPGSYPDQETCRERPPPAATSGEDGAATAAMCLYVAFALGEPDLGNRYATPAAVDSLFRMPWAVSPQEWLFHGCNVDATSSNPDRLVCSFTTPDDGGSTVVDVRASPSGDRMLIDDVYIGPEFGD